MDFSDRLNIISGLNGTGKTSIIDAIYCLAFGKSYFVSKEQYLLRDDSHFLRLEGQFQNENDMEFIKLILEQGKSKRIEVNGVKRNKLIDHIGHIPIVCIAPSDIFLVVDSSITRRKLLDKLLCQIDNKYTSALYNYNRLLKQRNAVLKRQVQDRTLINTLDTQMESPATYIFEQRKHLLSHWLELFHPIHQRITGELEVCEFDYKSQLLSKTFHEGIAEAKEKDSILKRSNFGIHKDDIVFTIRQSELKNVASQGQIKSFLFALKMSMMHILKEKTKKTPILLLDDIFDKLDETRVLHVLDYVYTDVGSQIFITDTSSIRLENIVKKQNYSHQIIHL